MNIPDNLHTSPDITGFIPGYHPLFAFELEKTDLALPGNEHTDTFVTPTGLFLSQFFMTGTLTSCEQTSGKRAFIRIADPTGAITLHLRPRFQDYYAEPAELVPPLFLSVTGILERSSGLGIPRYRCILESCIICTKKERDGWILQATDALVSRLDHMQEILTNGNATREEKRVMDHYRITPAQLIPFAEKAKKAVDIIREKQEEINPSEVIISVLREYSGPKGMNVEDLYRYTRRSAVPDTVVKDTIRSLIAEDEVYQPSPGYIKIL